MIFCCLLLASCFYKAQAHAAVNIFACEPEWAALATDIGGDKVDVTAATVGTEDPHHIAAKPSLLAAMRRADLVFCTGAGLEAGWLPVLMQQAASAAVQPGSLGNLFASDSVALLDKPQVIDRAMGDVHPEGNPHINTDARIYLPVARVLAERLGKIDAANAQYYQARLMDFTSRLQSDLQKWQNAAAPLRGLPVIVYHDSWAYLNNWLGLNQIGTLEDKPGVPPSPGHLQNLLQAARSAQVKTIMLTPFDDDEAAKWLAVQTGAHLVHLPFTVGGVNNTDSVNALFDRTIELLKGTVMILLSMQI